MSNAFLPKICYLAEWYSNSELKISTFESDLFKSMKDTKITKKIIQVFDSLPCIINKTQFRRNLTQRKVSFKPLVTIK